jgi:hypothetical protein
MLLRLLFVLAFLMPFAGIIAMEQGEFGGSIAEFGYRNYATEAFALFMIITFFAYKLLGSILPRIYITRESSINDNRFRRGLILSVFVLCIASFIILIFFGGINTILGNVDKGVFRTSLGPFGAAAYFILKFLAPGILAVAMVSAKHIKTALIDYVLIISLLILSSLVALSFGFKSGIIILLLPSLVLVMNKLSIKNVLILSGLIVSLIFSGYYFFESLDNDSAEFVLSLIIDRLSVLQGAVPWKLWDMLLNGEAFPSYLNTLPAIFGDKFLSITTGITPENNAYQWVMMHSALIPTYLSGYSPDEIVNGHNNTATSFSEGILFAGYLGILIFAILGGFVIRISIYWIEKAISRCQYVSASVSACFAINCVWSWVMSGGINTIFHISVLVNFAVLYVLLKLVFEYGSNKSIIHRR